LSLRKQFKSKRTSHHSALPSYEPEGRAICILELNVSLWRGQGQT